LKFEGPSEHKYMQHNGNGLPRKTQSSTPWKILISSMYENKEYLTP